MILFTILLITVLTILAVALVCTIVGGISFAVVFGDVIVFAFIVWLIYKITHRKKKKQSNKKG
jgi:O-antigen/teichoic acid export membrane protein